MFWVYAIIIIIKYDYKYIDPMSISLVMGWTITNMTQLTRRYDGIIQFIRTYLLYKYIHRGMYTKYYVLKQNMS